MAPTAYKVYENTASTRDSTSKTLQLDSTSNMWAAHYIKFNQITGAMNKPIEH